MCGQLASKKMFDSRPNKHHLRSVVPQSNRPIYSLGFKGGKDHHNIPFLCERVMTHDDLEIQP